MISAKALHHRAIAAAEQKLAKMPVAEQRGIETGVRGGRYYVSAIGQKVYVKDNPGPEIVGHVCPHPFKSGLPATCFMQEPFKR